MFDLNTILSAALQQAVEAATKPLLERIRDLEIKAAALESRPAGTGGGLTREEVREIANEAAEDAITGHCSDYDHDDFVSDLSAIDWADYFDIDDKVRDAVGNLTFEVSVN